MSYRTYAVIGVILVWLILFLSPLMAVNPYLFAIGMAVAFGVLVTYTSNVVDAISGKNFNASNQLILGIYFTWSSFLLLELWNIYGVIAEQSTRMNQSRVTQTLFLMNIIGGLMHLTALEIGTKKRWVRALITIGGGLALGGVLVAIGAWFLRRAP